uniref:Uncharacterized protein n=1 Tax=Felis catus TaxID=9685 RepID=A0ABI7VR72_FELCA
APAGIRILGPARGGGRCPRPTRDLWTELSTNFSAPRLAAETRPPTPLPTHCFSCASRSLTSASRLFTKATSSSSRSCSRRFWASVFCQSAEDGRLVTHPQDLGKPASLPAFSSCPVSLRKPCYRTTN